MATLYPKLHPRNIHLSSILLIHLTDPSLGDLGRLLLLKSMQLLVLRILLLNGA